MKLITLLHVCSDKKFRIRKGIDYENTGEVTDIVYSGVPGDVPEELLSYMVLTFDRDNDWLDVVIAGE